MKFLLKSAFQFNREGLKGWSYNSKDEFDNTSAAYIEISDKKHGKVRTRRSDRVYYVAEGSGVFAIEDKEIEVNFTDVVIIPKNTIYDFWAKKGTTMKLFLVHSPAFDPEYEETLSS